MELFKEKFSQDKAYKEKVLEQIMIFNDRFINAKKSQISANLFLAHLNDKFDWEAFISLLDCLDKLNLSAIDYLDNFAKEDNDFHKGYHEFNDNVNFLVSAGIAQIWGNHLTINAHGQYLYHYGIKGDLDFIFVQKEEGSKA
jgi:hypothetical protein